MANSIHQRSQQKPLPRRSSTLSGWIASGESSRIVNLVRLVRSSVVFVLSSLMKVEWDIKIMVSPARFSFNINTSFSIEITLTSLNSSNHQKH